MTTIQPNPTFHAYDLQTIWIQFDAADIPQSGNCCDVGHCCNYESADSSDSCQTVALTKLAPADADGRTCVWGADFQGPVGTSIWRLWLMPNGLWVLYNLCAASERCHTNPGDTTWTIPFLGTSTTTSFRSEETDWGGCTCQFFSMQNGYPDVYVIPGTPAHSAPPTCGSECGSSMMMSLLSRTAAQMSQQQPVVRRGERPLRGAVSGGESYQQIFEKRVREGTLPSLEERQAQAAAIPPERRSFAWRREDSRLTERPDTEKAI